MRKTFYSFVAMISLLTLFLGSACVTRNVYDAGSMAGHQQSACSHCSKHPPVMPDTNNCCVAHHQPGSTTAWTEVEQPAAASVVDIHDPLSLTAPIAPSWNRFTSPAPNPPRITLRI